MGAETNHAMRVTMAIKVYINSVMYRNFHTFGAVSTAVRAVLSIYLIPIQCFYKACLIYPSAKIADLACNNLQ